MGAAAMGVMQSVHSASLLMRWVPPARQGATVRHQMTLAFAGQEMLPLSFPGWLYAGVISFIFTVKLGESSVIHILSSICGSCLLNCWLDGFYQAT